VGKIYLLLEPSEVFILNATTEYYIKSGTSVSRKKRNYRLIVNCNGICYINRKIMRRSGELRRLYISIETVVNLINKGYLKQIKSNQLYSQFEKHFSTSFKGKKALAVNAKILEAYKKNAAILNEEYKQKKKDSEIIYLTFDEIANLEPLANLERIKASKKKANSILRNLTPDVLSELKNAFAKRNRKILDGKTLDEVDNNYKEILERVKNNQS